MSGMRASFTGGSAKVDDQRPKMTHAKVCAVFIFVYACVCIFTHPLCYGLVNSSNGCGSSLDDAETWSVAPNTNDSTAPQWDYPGYRPDNERVKRRWALLGLSQMEADFGRRIVFAVVAGAIIGFERRSPDRSREQCLLMLPLTTLHRQTGGDPHYEPPQHGSRSFHHLWHLWLLERPQQVGRLQGHRRHPFRGGLPRGRDHLERPSSTCPLHLPSPHRPPCR